MIKKKYRIWIYRMFLFMLVMVTTGQIHPFWVTTIFCQFFTLFIVIEIKLERIEEKND